MKKAFLFPGQGSQKIGMGKNLSDNFDVAKKVFEEVDEALEFKLSDLIWNGEIDELTLTENAQPAIMANSMAIWYTLKSEGYIIDNDCVVAGHSLGEYSALCAVGSLSLSQTAKLLRIRGRAMQNAVKFEMGAMAAIIGLNFGEVSKVIEEVKKTEFCEIANYNEPNQIVISGFKKAILLAVEIAKTYGAKRCILLNVSAPFHCKLMRNATLKMEKIINKQNLKELKYKVVSNVTASKYDNNEEIKKLLIEQIEKPVRWRESINYMILNGTSEFVEIGPGKVLSGLIKRINKDVKVLNIDKVEDIQSLNI